MGNDADRIPDPSSGTEVFGRPLEQVRFSAGDLDHSTSPRVDLDAFVNARWRAANPLPPDRSCWDAFAILAQRSQQIRAKLALTADRSRSSVHRVVADFWTSGMDAAAIERLGIDPLRPELARIDALDSRRAIVGYVADRHARGWEAVFALDAEPDFEDPATTIACVTQAELALPDRDAYLGASARSDEQMRAYRRHIAAMLAFAGTPIPVAQQHADAVLALETSLAEASTSWRSIARDVSLRQRAVTLDDAERSTPGFSWRAFFATLGIDAPQRFSLAMPDFHVRVAELLHSVPIDTWKAYFRFHAIDDTAPLLNDAIATAHYRFHRAFLRGQRAIAPRWKRVLGTIDAYAGEAMGEIYAACDFSAPARDAARALAERLREALRMRIERVDWMTASSRSAALRKLAAMTAKIGYPDRWPDWSDLATSPTDVFGNVAAARAFERRRLVARIGQPTDRARWRILPQTVNAGYDPQRNEVEFPAALLQPPFFDAGADAALNYGGIGAVIAHEMIHGFDDQGSRFGADGRFEDTWTAEDRARFAAQAERIVTQFDARTLDGRRTLGENIADFGGLAIAFDALTAELDAYGRVDPLIDGYTQAQRFFMSWATIWRQNLSEDEAGLRRTYDEHAPAPVRANAAPSNLDAYARAFGCAPGDAMWRPAGERVRIW